MHQPQQRGHQQEGQRPQHQRSPPAPLPFYSLAEVARHRAPGDGWIVVNGVVYDITAHVRSVMKTDTSGTQLASTLAHLGSDCSEEFAFIHSHIPAAKQQLPLYKIGYLEQA